MNQETTEEEDLVILQFTDIDDANYAQQFSHQFKTIDIEKNSPVIQIGNRFYKGEYTNNIGTYLLFEQKPEEEEPLSTPETEVKSEYSGKSFKKLVLSRLFIEEKVIDCDCLIFNLAWFSSCIFFELNWIPQRVAIWKMWLSSTGVIFSMFVKF